MDSVKVAAWNTVHHVIHNDLIDPDMKRWTVKFDGELEKRLNDTNFVDYDEADLYIYDVDEANEGNMGMGPIIQVMNHIGA